MKQIFLIAITLILSHFSHAQINVGIKGGGSLMNQKANVRAGSMFAGDDLKGFHAGLLAELSLDNNLYLQPQLLFARKGAQYMSSTRVGDHTVKINYLEVPVHLIYKLDVPFGKLYAGAGGSFSYAIGGKEVRDGGKRSLYGGAIKDWKRVDAGLSFTAGLQLKNGLFASVNSYKGLLDIYKGGDASVKNKSTSVSVGYLADLRKIYRRG